MFYYKSADWFTVYALFLLFAEIKEIEGITEQLNQELYEAVDEELNKAGQDTKRVEALMNEIVKLKNQLNAYEERQELAAKY